jgi:hypothetical protein
MISQFCVLIVLLPFRPRAVSVASVSLLNACYLVLFNAWVFSQPRPDGAAWLIYIIALCVEAGFAVMSVLWIRARNLANPLLVGFVTAGFGLAGISIVQGFFASLLWLGTRT